MAVKLFDLFGDISLRTGDVQKQLDQVRSKAQQVGAKVQDVGKKLSSFGSTMTTRVTVPLVAVGGLLVKLGSDAEEVRAKFETAFRDVREQADETARNLAQNYGLSQTAAERLLSGTGDLLKGFGATGEQALGLSNQVQELAVDLASYNNVQGGAERASEVLTKAMLGERDALTSLGIKISEIDVQQRLLEKGQQDLTGRSLLLAKAQATLELAYQQSGDAIGDFARTQDSVANQMRQLRADAEDLATSFRSAVLPVAQDLIARARQLVQWFTQLDEATKENIVRFAAMAAAAGPLALGIGKVVTAIGFLIANPVVAGIAAVAAGVAAIAVAVRNARQAQTDELLTASAEKLAEAAENGENLADSIQRVSTETGLSVDEVIRLAEEQGLVTGELESQIDLLREHAEKYGDNAKSAEDVARENTRITEQLEQHVANGADMRRVVIDYASELGIAVERAISLAEEVEGLTPTQREQLELLKEQTLETKETAAKELERAETHLSITSYREQSADAAADEAEKQAEITEELAEQLRIEKERVAGVVEGRLAAEEAYNQAIRRAEVLRDLGEADEEEFLRAQIRAAEEFRDALIELGYTGELVERTWVDPVSGESVTAIQQGDVALSKLAGETLPRLRRALDGLDDGFGETFAPDAKWRKGLKDTEDGLTDYGLALIRAEEATADALGGVRDEFDETFAPDAKWKKESKKSSDEVEEDWTETAIAIANAIANTFSAFVDYIGALSEARQQEIDAQAERELAAAREKYSALTIEEQAYQDYLDQKEAERYESLTEEQKREYDLRAAANESRKELEEELAAEEERIERERAIAVAKIQQEQAKRERRIRAFQATIDTAAAIIRFLIDPGGVAGVALSVAAGLTGAAQLAAIFAAPLPPIPQFQQGGVVPGTDYTGDNVVARVNSGEMILTRNMQENLLNMLAARQPVVAQAPSPSVSTTTTFSSNPQFNFQSMFDLSNDSTKRRAAQELYPYFEEERRRRS